MTCICGHGDNWHWHHEGGCCYGPANNEPPCECFMYEPESDPSDAMH